MFSWNFKHIVNLREIEGFNSVNLNESFDIIEIMTLQEVA